MYWKRIYNKNALEMNLSHECTENDFTIKMNGKNFTLRMFANDFIRMC